MPSLQSPTAKRLRRPGWTDPRFLVGVALVSGATLVGALVWDDGSESQLWAAREPLVVGDVVEAADLEPVQGQVPEGYLTGSKPVPAGDSAPVVVRSVPSGELVPLSALGRPGEVDLRRVALPVEPASAALLSRGMRADLWVAGAPDPGGEVQMQAEPILTAIEVAAVAELPGQMGNTTAAVAVEVMVPPQDVARVLQAVSGDARVTAVPVAGGGESGGG